jgi:hypothetical protein
MDQPEHPRKAFRQVRGQRSRQLFFGPSIQVESESLEDSFAPFPRVSRAPQFAPGPYLFEVTISSNRGFSHHSSARAVFILAAEAGQG